MKYFFSAICFFIGISFANAQTNNEYAKADNHAMQLGALKGFNVATIADTLTQPFTDKQSKARVIYYWITHNISWDLKNSKSNDNKNIDPVLVIQSRTATPLGFSTLFQEMCSQANIRCLTVDGYTKYSFEDINNPADEINHSWNVVQLGNSPTEWYYVDAAKGSGFPDKKFKVFNSEFTSEYFFADKSLFNLDHFPDNMSWQLGNGPKTKKDFYSLPVIYNVAYVLRLKSITPVTGYVKTKLKNAVAFNLKLDNSDSIQIVAIQMGDDKKISKPEAMNFSNNGSGISFNYQFKKDDVFPLKILADGKCIAEYMMEVTE